MTNITKQLADTVTNTGVRTAYGDPVELNGDTLIPVSVGVFGFGGGEGSGTLAEGPEAALEDGDAEQAFSGGGSGGGGGGISLPIGAYVTREDRTRFEPNVIALLTVGTPFVWVAGRALARVIRALKK